MTSKLAEALHRARTTGETLAPGDFEPLATMAEAYAVQDELAGLAGSAVVGWKLGATNAAAMEKFGIEEPTSGRVFEHTCFADGATVPAALFHHRAGIECEIALRVGRDHLPGDEPLTAATARDLVETIHPAIELVCTRFVGNLGEASTNQITADGFAHAALVVGPGAAPDPDDDLSTARCRLVMGGEELATGLADAAMGSPYAALAWFAGHLSDRGIPLRAGEIVATGSCTGITPSEPGTVIVNDVGPVGQVSTTVVG